MCRFHVSSLGWELSQRWMIQTSACVIVEVANGDNSNRTLSFADRYTSRSNFFRHVRGTVVELISHREIIQNFIIHSLFEIVDLIIRDFGRRQIYGCFTRPCDETWKERRQRVPSVQLSVSQPKSIVAIAVTRCCAACCCMWSNLSSLPRKLQRIMNYLRAQSSFTDT